MEPLGTLAQIPFYAEARYAREPAAPAMTAAALDRKGPPFVVYSEF